MKRFFFCLMTLLALAVLFAVPTQPAAADGAEHVYFSVSVENLCWPVRADPRCGAPAQWMPLPNGKGFVVGFTTINKFTATDPRWNVDCFFTSNPIPPGGNATPIKGSFVCIPRDPALKGGWWEGSTRETAMPDKWIGVFTAKGYGDFDGLLTISSNSISAHYDQVEIIELPGY